MSIQNNENVRIMAGTICFIPQKSPGRFVFEALVSTGDDVIEITIDMSQEDIKKIHLGMQFATPA